MKPALHRSVVFWLGCIVLLFLVWMWVDSWKWMTTVRRDWSIDSRTGGVVAGHSDEVRLSNGRILIQWSRATITDSTLELNHLSVACRRSGAASGKGTAMPRARRFVQDEVKGARVVCDIVEVPMWGVTGLYGMLFTGVVMWRRRRWRRVLLESGRTEEGVTA